MDLVEYRKGRGLSQEQAATELGLKSKGYLSSIESGRFSCPLKLALQIEVWSGGEVRAADLVDEGDSALLRAIARGAEAEAAP